MPNRNGASPPRLKTFSSLPCGACRPNDGLCGRAAVSAESLVCGGGQHRSDVPVRVSAVRRFHRITGLLVDGVDLPVARVANARGLR